MSGKHCTKLRRTLTGYMDCVIVATAVALREDLVSEDRVILSHREELEKNYGLESSTTKIYCNNPNITLPHSTEDVIPYHEHYTFKTNPHSLM